MKGEVDSPHVDRGTVHARCVRVDELRKQLRYSWLFVLLRRTHTDRVCVAVELKPVPGRASNSGLKFSDLWRKKDCCGVEAWVKNDSGVEADKLGNCKAGVHWRRGPGDTRRLI